MSDGAAARLADAGAAAEDLVAVLQPACERIEVAGSIRRLVDVVHDVELVAIPQFEDRQSQLWDPERANLLWERLNWLILDGRLAMHPTDPKLGERYAKLVDVASGLQLDLFMVLPPAQWGVLFLIRTGSANYSNWFVKAVRDRGFHVADGALHRGGLGCTLSSCEIVETPEERDVYAVTGIPFTPPHLRTIR